MITLIVVFSYILLLAIIKVGVKDLISKRILFIYISYWCLSLFLSANNFGNLYTVEDNTYFLLIGHLFSFLFGFIILKPASDNIAKNCNLNISKLLSNYLFIVIYIALFIYVAFLFIRQRSVLAIYGVSGIRGDFYELVVPSGQFTFFSTITTSFYHFSICMAFYLLLFYRRWWYVSFFFLFSFLFAFLGGGRNQLMTFVYYGVSMYILKDFIQSTIKGRITKYNFSTKYKLIASLIIFLAVFGMSYLTALRSFKAISAESLKQGLYDTGDVLVSYSVGPIVAFDQGINNKQFKKNNYWGSATFCGSEQVFYKFFLRHVLPNYEPAYDEITGYMQNNRINISPDRTWNYAYTSCFYYFRDFGIWGILLFPFILGYISRRIINLLERNLNIYSIALFFFLCYLLYMTVFSGYLHKNVTLIYIFVLLMLYFYSAKKNRNIHQYKL